GRQSQSAKQAASEQAHGIFPPWQSGKPCTGPLDWQVADARDVGWCMECWVRARKGFDDGLGIAAPILAKVPWVSLSKGKGHALSRPLSRTCFATPSGLSRDDLHLPAACLV